MMNNKIPIIAAFIFLSGVMCPTDIRGQDASAKSYQDLIRKNFSLREDLKSLENRYAELENERKVLILRVQELQKAKNARLAIIQNLKNMIASLKTEMLKDPRLAKIIDTLNQRIKKNRERKRSACGGGKPI